MGSPIPKVYAWCSRAYHSAIGAEYIIMEKMPGVPLAKMLAKMGIEERWKIFQAVMRQQKAWASFKFQQCGSLYYSQDLDKPRLRPFKYNANGIETTSSKFAVGPTTGRSWANDGRLAIKCNRGPCSAATI